MAKEKIMKEIECPKCCGSITLEDGSGVCKHCGHKVYPVIEEKPKLDNKIKEIAQKRNNGYFDDALKEIKIEIDSGIVSSELYLQQLYATFGIRFVEEDGVMKPTISRLSDYNIKEHEAYKKAIELAKEEYKDSNAVIKDIEASVEEIDDIRRKTFEISQSTDPFHIFICFKQRSILDKSAETEDCRIAEAIYDKLTEDYDYKVFFSKKTLKPGEDYEPVIFRALSTAKVMLVISATKPGTDSKTGTRINYLEEPWVRNEWSRYIEMRKTEKEQGRNNKNIIPVLANGVKPEDLPSSLSKFQGLNYDGVFFEKLIKDLEEYCPRDIGSKFARSSIQKRDVEKVEIQKKTFVRKTIGAGGASIALTPEIRQVIESAKDDLNSGNFKHARVYIDAKLEEKEFAKNGELNWLGFKAYLEVADESEIGQKTFYFADDEQKKKLQVYLANSVDGDGVSEKSAQKVFSSISKLALRCLSQGDIDSFEEFYNFLTNYLSEDQILSQAVEFADVVCNSLVNDNNGLGNYSAEKIRHLFLDVLNDAFTIGGTETIINRYDYLANVLNFVGEYDLSQEFTEEVLKIYELDISSLFVHFLNKYRINRYEEPDSDLIVRNIDNTESTGFIADLEKAISDTVSNKEFVLNKEDNDNIIFTAFSFVRAYIWSGKGTLFNKAFDLFKIIYGFVPTDDEYRDYASDYCSYFAGQFLSCGNEQTFQIVKDLCQEYIGTFGTTSFNVFLLQLLANYKCENIYELLAKGIDFETRENQTDYDTLNTAAYKDDSVDSQIWKEIVNLSKQARDNAEVRNAFNEASAVLRRTRCFINAEYVVESGATTSVNAIFEKPVVDGYMAYYHNTFVNECKFVLSTDDKASLEGKWNALNSEREDAYNKRQVFLEARREAVTASVLQTVGHVITAAVIAFVLGFLLRNPENNFQQIANTSWPDWIKWGYWVVFGLFVLFCGVVGAFIGGLTAWLFGKVVDDDEQQGKFFVASVAAFFVTGFANAIGHKSGIKIPVAEIIAITVGVLVTHYSESCRNKITGFWLPYVDIAACVGLIVLTRVAF